MSIVLRTGKAMISKANYFVRSYSLALEICGLCKQMISYVGGVWVLVCTTHRGQGGTQSRNHLSVPEKLLGKK